MKKKDASSGDDIPAEIDWSKSVPDDFDERFNLKGILLDRDLLKQFESVDEIEAALREFLARRQRAKRTA
jgi:hypothetical protein